MEQTERDSIKELLKINKLEIKFTKVDGTDSTITATLNQAFIPKKPVIEATDGSPAAPKKERKVNDSLLLFYSPDREDWRNVKYDLIKSYTIVQ
jgi:hypothetical protein